MTVNVVYCLIVVVFQFEFFEKSFRDSSFRKVTSILKKNTFRLPNGVTYYIKDKQRLELCYFDKCAFLFRTTRGMLGQVVVSEVESETSIMFSRF